MAVNNQPELQPAPPYRALAVPSTVIVVCGTGVMVVLVSAFTLLAFYGRDSTSLTNLVTVILGLVNVVLSGSAVVYAGSADRKAGRAIEQTNHSLDERMAATVRQELDRDPPAEPTT